MSDRPANPYARGTWGPHLLVGAAMIAGGVYGMARWLIDRHRAQVAQATSSPQVAIANRGRYTGQ